MKRAAAIILSLTLVWLQVLASAQSLSAPVPAACGCCAGQPSCCCVEPAAPEAKPLPAAPAAASASTDFTAVLAKLVAWTLPTAAPAIVSPLDHSASSLAVPLFTRHCALLI